MGKVGYWAGYTEYRYGQAKKPTLKRVLTGERREHVVSRAMDLMKDWRSSPFENEGATRHGLRAALCETGHRWSIADHEAEVVVAQIFRLMGAKRPTYDEGQPEYTDVPDHCAWCKGEVEPCDTGKRGRFCSPECARAMCISRSDEWAFKTSSIAWSASVTIRRERLDRIECVQCQRMFVPYNMDSNGRSFCSFRCKADAKHASLKPRLCDCCGDTFRPRHDTARFCSHACQQRDRKVRVAVAQGKSHNTIGTVFDGTCRHCHQQFMARSPKAIYCGQKCNSASTYLRKRQRNGNVIYLTAEIFDGWFRQAA